MHNATLRAVGAQSAKVVWPPEVVTPSCARHGCRVQRVQRRGGLQSRRSDHAARGVLLHQQQLLTVELAQGRHGTGCPQRDAGRNVAKPLLDRRRHGSPRWTSRSIAPSDPVTRRARCGNGRAAGRVVQSEAIGSVHAGPAQQRLVQPDRVRLGRSPGRRLAQHRGMRFGVAVRKAWRPLRRRRQRANEQDSGQQRTQGGDHGSWIAQ